MSTDSDALEGGESLSLDQAAAAYAKISTPSDAADSGQAEDEDDLSQDSDITADDDLEPHEGEGEDEGEPDAEGQAEEDDDGAEPDTEEGRFVASNGKVRLPDGSVSTVADLISGNLKERDYRQKTMEVAELKRSIETQSSAISQREEQLSQQRDLMVNLLKSIVPEVPDPSLATTDPYAYTRQKAEHDAWIVRLQQLEQQGHQTKQQKEAETAKAKKERGDREWSTLIEKMPGLKDQKRFSSFVSDIRDHGKQYGFTEAELAEAVGYDHRQALVMRDAIAWRKLQASKPKVQSKVEGRPPVQRSGKRLSPDEQKARSTNVAMDRLKSSGRVDDAVQAYLASRKG